MPQDNQNNTAVQDAPNDAPNDAPKTKSIDLFGKEFNLPSDVADAIIPLRDAYKADKNDNLDSRLSSIEERIRADVEAKEKAEFDKKLEQFKQENDVDNIKKLIEGQYQTQLKQLSDEKAGLMSKIIDGSIKDALRGVDNLLPSIVDDAMIIYKSQFDVNAEGEVFAKGTDAPILNNNGERVSVADHVKSFVSNKPQFIKANVGNGTGATGAADIDPKTGARAMSREEYEKIMADGGQNARKIVNQINQGKLTII
jgi:hypothetical protein